MRARFAAAFLALTTAFLGGLARAGEQSVEVDGVRVTISTNWPAALNRGWQPAVVHVANSTAEARTARLTFTCSPGPGTDVVVQEVRVPAGGAERFEIVLPARPHLPNAYSVSIEAGQRGFLSAVGATQASPAHERIVLVASRAGPSTVRVAGWATELSRESEPRAPPEASSAHAVRRGSATVLIGVAPGSAAAPTTAPEHVRVTGIAFESLSSLPEAYTSLHALVLDVGDGTPPTRGVLDAITAWVRSGGVLAVAGRGAGQFLSKEPSLAAWVDPRFRAGSPQGSALYACGLGLLLVFEGEEVLADSSQVAALNAAIELCAPFVSVAPHSTFDIPIPGIEVPFRSLTLLLVLFAILVGPVNLIFVRRSGRPALLLLTIPAIAFVFSIGLIAYGAAAQGLDVRATSSSVGVLDQRSHHGSSHERRQVFAGLAAGPGLCPGPGVVVERVADEALDWSTRREYRATYDSGLTLSGAWLPVRTPTRFSVSVDRAARGRIDIERTSDGWKATNGLDTRVEVLLFRDFAGDIHEFEGPIVAGRSATASADAPDAELLDELASADVLAAELAEGSFLPRGAWIARVARSPLIDPVGLEYEEAAGEHVLMGILELEEKR